MFYFACLVSIVILGNYFQILYNRTNSIPYKIFIVVKNGKFKRGDYVAISGHQSKYTKNIHFTKIVAAMPGDLLKVLDNVLYFNNQQVQIRELTIDNRTLTPLIGTVVPEGEYLVLGEHDSSFDSRYREFGLVKHANITGRAIPIF